MSKIRKKVSYIHEDGFELGHEPIEDSLQIKETKEGFEVRYLVSDDTGYSPDDDKDENLFLVAYHRDFWVDRKDFISKDKCIDLYRYLYSSESFNFDKEEIESFKDYTRNYHIFALEAYIHSGVALALKNEGNFPDRRWDVSQLGCIFASKKEWRLRKSARKAAIGLIKYWNQYLSGDVYGCVVEYFDKDKKFKDHDSCFGFYGYKYASEELINFR
jgi:hypothetical protein